MTPSIRINIAFVLSLTAILFSACQQAELPKAPETTDSTDIVYATIEDPADTRTSLDGEKVLWSSGDQIVVFKGETLRRKYVVSSETVGTNEGSFVRDNGYEHIGASEAISHNVAFYPFAEITCKAEGQTYTLETITLPSVQTYAPDSFGPNSFPMMAVSADTEDVDFRFKNLCGALKLQLQGEGAITSITLKGNCDETLAGSASVTMFRGEEPFISLASDGAKEVTLDCPEGVSLNADTPTSFLISLPPTIFANGFTVTVTDTWGGAKEFTTNKKNVIARSQILRMPIKEYIGIRLPQEGDYIDEYGINHGPGVEIDGVVWAPVNCGYHETDFKYGKLYQWGRKYGQGYSGNLYDIDRNHIGEYSDASVPELIEGPIGLSIGQSKDNADKFYYNTSLYPYDWSVIQYNKFWNYGTEQDPIKSEYDPCPANWRVPTFTELKELKLNYSSWSIDEHGLNGKWFSGASAYTETSPQVFLPAAGSRNVDGEAQYIGFGGSYWSSTPNGAYAYILDFYGSMNAFMGSCGRAYGYSIRCVQDDSELMPVETISLSKTSLTLIEGSSEVLSATIVPSNATHQTPFWWSDNPSVATVDSNGNVTAVSEGTTVITAMAGMQVATCEVTVIASNQKDYIDEYGINHGPGVEIDGIVWAPVNCGYHKEDFKYGKLYQWGRKYGQGYSGNLYDGDGNSLGKYSDAVVPVIRQGAVDLSTGQSESNGNYFYRGSAGLINWLSPSDDDLWNAGKEDSPTKTEYDPCPAGWRVPLHSELASLCKSHSSWVKDSSGQEGFLFSGEDASDNTASQFFLPAAGARSGDGNGDADYRGRRGYYWSSKPYNYSLPPYYTVNYYDAIRLYFINDGFNYSGHSVRANGYSVRCVQE